MHGDGCGDGRSSLRHTRQREQACCRRYKQRGLAQRRSSRIRASGFSLTAGMCFLVCGRRAPNRWRRGNLPEARDTWRRGGAQDRPGRLALAENCCRANSNALLHAQRRLQHREARQTPERRWRLLLSGSSLAWCLARDGRAAGRRAEGSPARC